MKIKTILGILLILALVVGSTGVATADEPTQTRDDWELVDGVLVPLLWVDGTPPDCDTVPENWQWDD